jgi:hypothetical protein
MPSPFPGMNPYREQDVLWSDFHLAFLPTIRARLVAQVRPNYIVLLDEHIYVHELPPEPRRLLGRADVSLAEGSALESGRPSAAGVLEAPAQVHLITQDVERVPFLEIRDRLDRELITVLEFLSPSHKRAGGDREQYPTKRAQLLDGPVNFVEIDLLRGGRPMPLADRPVCDYSVLVSRAEARPVADFWPIGLRDRLAVIPVPLRSSDGNARIDLQEILNAVYDAAGYEDFVYNRSPEPLLEAADAAWTLQFVPRAP